MKCYTHTHARIGSGIHSGGGAVRLIIKQENRKSLNIMKHLYIHHVLQDHSSKSFVLVDDLWKSVCVHVRECMCPVSGTDAITESHQHLNASQYCIYILHRNNIQNMHYSIFLLSPRIPRHDEQTRRHIHADAPTPHSHFISTLIYLPVLNKTSSKILVI